MEYSVTPGSNPSEKTHVVQPGEHIGLIAARYGFSDYKEIWEHDNNSALRNKRSNPMILAAGDEIFIPKKDGISIKIKQFEAHTITLNIAEYQLRVKCLDLNRQTITRNSILTRDNGDTIATVLEEDIYTATIRANDTKLDMTFPDAPPLPAKDEIPLVIGGLNPITEPSGQQQRLNNLGYFAGFDDEPDPESTQFKWAVEEFQKDNGLTVDGKCGPKTQEKLESVHGI
jgi:N-acetylmuramoyl-L-alanine amidase